MKKTVLYAKVILDMSNSKIDRVFDYEIPFEFLDKAETGMRVKVPFGKKLVDGYIVDISSETDVEADKIKLIHSLTDKESLISPQMASLAKWMKERYLANFSSCLRLLIPAGADLKNTVKSVFLTERKKAEEFVELNKEKPRLLAQVMVLNFLLTHESEEETSLRKKLNITSSPIKTLEKNGYVRFENTRKMRKDSFFVKPYKKHILNEEQQKACERILNGGEKPFLLFGVTGSGKTEVYLQVIEKLIAEGKKAILLVPEISLTPLMVERFKGRFGSRAAVTHSRMSDGERLDIWLKAKYGEVDIVIGPRSAVFMPFENLGAIIIDEEHDGSYKSEVTPKYDALETAWQRCKMEGAKLILGSATPSVKSMYKAEKGKYELIKMTKRAGKGKLPNCEIVDMRRELEEGNLSVLSRLLQQKIAENLENKKQTMLFINRRGASTFVSCRKCGHVMMCSRCNVSYKYHSDGNFLMCHYCGKREKVPRVCPKCGSKYIKYFGAGTQRVENEVKQLFPKARVLRMDFDTVSGKNGHFKILEKFKNHEADILVGRQMIAKGHDFADVSLVGIVAADLSLNSADYTGTEKTFQLITQTAGRAGRRDGEGKVIIQTYSPENFAVKTAAKHDYEAFYKEEIKMRRMMNYPPFGYVYTLLATGKNENRVSEAVSVLGDIFKKNAGDDFEVLGPSEALISKIRDEYRYRLMIKGCDDEKMRKYTQKCMELFGGRNGYKDVYVNLFMNGETVV